MHGQLIMVSPDWTKIFHIYTDASDRALGGTLMQEKTIGYLQPIYYASKSMTKTEKNYNTTEREALGIIYAVAKFKHYLLGNKFVLTCRPSSLGLHSEQSFHSRQNGPVDVDLAGI